MNSMDRQKAKTFHDVVCGLLFHHKNEEVFDILPVHMQFLYLNMAKQYEEKVQAAIAASIVKCKHDLPKHECRVCG